MLRFVPRCGRRVRRRCQSMEPSIIHCTGANGTMTCSRRMELDAADMRGSAVEGWLDAELSCSLRQRGHVRRDDETVSQDALCSCLILRGVRRGKYVLHRSAQDHVGLVPLPFGICPRLYKAMIRLDREKPLLELGHNDHGQRCKKANATGC